MHYVLGTFLSIETNKDDIFFCLWITAVKWRTKRLSLFQFEKIYHLFIMLHPFSNSQRRALNKREVWNKIERPLHPTRILLIFNLCEETISRTDEGQPRPKYIFNKCGTNIYFFTLQRFGPSPNFKVARYYEFKLSNSYVWNLIV